MTSLLADLKDRVSTGCAYGNLAIAFQGLCDFRRAIEYQNLHLSIAKEVDDKAMEGRAYGNLGNAFYSLSEFKKAIDYHMLDLRIAKDLKDKAEEGRSYGNLGNAFNCLGDFKKAIHFHRLHLSIAKDMGDQDGEGSAYCYLGNAFHSLGDFQKAIDYHNQCLNIAKDIGDKEAEGRAYNNLGIAYYNLDDFRKAIDYHKLSRTVAKDVGNKSGEGKAYYNLGNAFRRLGDLKKAIDYYNLDLRIVKELEDKGGEARVYDGLGRSFETLGLLPEAEENFQASVRLFDDVRSLQSEDEWKVGFRNECDISYKSLWRVMLKQGKIVEALFAAEKGRAQALTDLMGTQCGFQESHSGLPIKRENNFDKLSCIPASTIFQTVDEVMIRFWVVLEGQTVDFRYKELDNPYLLNHDPTSFFQSLIEDCYGQIGVRSGVRCENRSMDAFREESSAEETRKCTQPSVPRESSLSTLYDTLIKPIANLVERDELIIVPDGPLWLAPYAALMDSDSTYLCETFEVRLIPSLASLKMIVDCPDDYHKMNGALLVGNPWVAEVTDSKGEQLLDQLPFAKQEVEMIGRILKVTPLIPEPRLRRMRC